MHFHSRFKNFEQKNQVLIIHYSSHKCRVHRNQGKCRNSRNVPIPTQSYYDFMTVLTHTIRQNQYRLVRCAMPRDEHVNHARIIRHASLIRMKSIDFIFLNSHSISLGLWFASCLLSPATINHNSKFKNSIINPRIDAYDDTMIRYYHIIHCICKFHSIGQNPRILLTDFFLLFFCV